MPRPRRFLFNGHVVFITTSVEEGLLLPCNGVMNLIIESSLAHAQSLYPIRICCYLVEGTHLHIIAVVDNPVDIVRFMERFKTESAHRINRLLGRKKRTVWCEGYDAPVLLTQTTVIDKIVYIYSNPSKDNLEDSIERYPGLSSWGAFRSGINKKRVPYIRRPSVEQLLSDKLTIAGYNNIARRLKQESKDILLLRIEPDAWMECFGIDDKEERDIINAEIVSKLREREAQYRLQRKTEGKSVIGRDRLIASAFKIAYVPNRTGKRMWCHCDDPVLRRQFINWLKYQIEIAKQVFDAWRQGDFSLAFPIGLFPPSTPRTANLYSGAVYC